MIKGIDGHSDNDQLIHIWASLIPLSDTHWVGRDGFSIILDRLEFFAVLTVSSGWKESSLNVDII